MLKLPETVTDQILLCLTLILFGCSSTMISLVVQEKPIPPEFKDFAQQLGIGVLGGISFNKLTK